MSISRRYRLPFIHRCIVTMNKLPLIPRSSGKTDRIRSLLFAACFLLASLNHGCSSKTPPLPTGSGTNVHGTPAESLRALHDPDPQRRRAAAERLAEQNGVSGGVGELIGLLDDRDPFVRQAAARSLGRLGAKEAIGPLTAMLNDSDMAVKQWVIWALGRIGGSESLKHLVDLLGSGDGRIKHYAAEALSNYRSGSGEHLIDKLFISAIYSSNPADLARCAHLLDLYGEESALVWILGTTKNPHKGIDHALRLRDPIFLHTHHRLHDLGLLALKKMAIRPLVIEKLINRLELAVDQNDFGEQEIIGNILVQLKDPLAAPFFRKVLRDANRYWPGVRGDSCLYFVGTNDQEVIGLLRKAILDEDTGKNLKTKAITAFQGNRDPEVQDYLLSAMEELRGPVETRRAAIDALAAVEDKRLVNALEKIVKTKRERWLLQAHSLVTLGKMSDPAALQTLLSLLESDRYELVRVRIIEIVKHINDPAVTETLQRVSERDRFVLVRNRAAKALKERM